jgi:hypothetical protein
VAVRQVLRRQKPKKAREQIDQAVREAECGTAERESRKHLHMERRQVEEVNDSVLTWSGYDFTVHDRVVDD